MQILWQGRQRKAWWAVAGIQNLQEIHSPVAQCPSRPPSANVIYVLPLTVLLYGGFAASRRAIFAHQCGSWKAEKSFGFGFFWSQNTPPPDIEKQNVSLGDCLSVYVQTFPSTTSIWRAEMERVCAMKFSSCSFASSHFVVFSCLPAPPPCPDSPSNYASLMKTRLCKLQNSQWGNFLTEQRIKRLFWNSLACCFCHVQPSTHLTVTKYSVGSGTGSESHSIKTPCGCMYWILEGLWLGFL